MTAHQPNYLPYPGFFDKIAGSDVFVIVDTTQFVKRGPFGWIHRNRIRTPQGPAWLSLPVLSKGKYDQSILEARLNPRVDWRRKHWRSIEWNYRTAPHWSRYAPTLRAIYESEWTHLAPLTTAIIRWFMDQLELRQKLIIGHELEARGVSTEYIMALCRELSADVFLSGVHGRDYLDLALFKHSGIELRFQHYEPPQYDDGSARRDEGVSLSMLDMLFWSGPAAVAWVHRSRDTVTP